MVIKCRVGPQQPDLQPGGCECHQANFVVHQAFTYIAVNAGPSKVIVLKRRRWSKTTQSTFSKHLGPVRSSAVGLGCPYRSS